MESHDLLNTLFSTMNVEANVTKDKLEVFPINKKRINALVIVFGIIGVIIMLLGLLIQLDYENGLTTRLIIIAFGLIVILVTLYFKRNANSKIIIDKVSGNVIRDTNGKQKVLTTISNYKNLLFVRQGVNTTINFVKIKGINDITLAIYYDVKKQGDFKEQFNTAFNNWLLS